MVKGGRNTVGRLANIALILKEEVNEVVRRR
jgi:hypothetical protein